MPRFVVVCVLCVVFLVLPLEEPFGMLLLDDCLRCPKTKPKDDPGRQGAQFLSLSTEPPTTQSLDPWLPPPMRDPRLNTNTSPAGVEKPTKNQPPDPGRTGVGVYP